MQYYFLNNDDGKKIIIPSSKKKSMILNLSHTMNFKQTNKYIIFMSKIR